MSPPLFIVGYARSGTTLLRAMLGQHSGVHLLNELDLIPLLVLAGYGLDQNLDSAQRREFFGGLKPRKRRKFEQLPSEQLEEFLNGTKSRRCAQLYEHICGIVHEKPIVWGEKSVLGIYYVNVLLHCFPQARFIHIVRDPRAVALSKYVKSVRQSNQLELSETEILGDLDWKTALTFFCTHALRWLQMMDLAQRHSTTIGTSQWLEVTYENLVEQPREVLACCCDFLDINYEERMTAAEPRGDDPLFAKYGARVLHGLIAKELEPARTRAFMDLPRQLLLGVEHYAAPQMRRYGYSCKRCSSELWVRARTLIAIRTARNAILSNVDSHFRRFVKPAMKINLN